MSEASIPSCQHCHYIGTRLCVRMSNRLIGKCRASLTRRPDRSITVRPDKSRTKSDINDLTDDVDSAREDFWQIDPKDHWHMGEHLILRLKGYAGSGYQLGQTITQVRRLGMSSWFYCSWFVAALYIWLRAWLGWKPESGSWRRSWRSLGCRFCITLTSLDDDLVVMGINIHTCTLVAIGKCRCRHGKNKS